MRCTFCSPQLQALKCATQQKIHSSNAAGIKKVVLNFKTLGNRSGSFLSFISSVFNQAEQ